MDTLNARPKLLKHANLTLIRKAIREHHTATRAEIVAKTKISSTTVRSLLSEMLQNGEIESIGHDESSGGRKAERYRFSPDRYYSVAFCITGNQADALLINICGEIVETTKLDVTGEDFEPAIITYLDKLTAMYEIKSIGLGVPGIVEGGSYWRESKLDNKLYKMDIGDALSKRYNLPIVMENDLNATTIGFANCYAKEFPSENPNDTNIAYLHFEEGCISAGFIAGGKIIRGYKNFAGELGLIPMDNDKSLDECIDAVVEDAQYVNLVTKVISFICGILNPQYVVLGGPHLRKDCIGPIGDVLSSLPKHMFAEILYSPDVWQDYHAGMAYLTAGKMFDDIQFIKD